MFRGIFVCALAASAMLPGLAAARAAAATPSIDDNSNDGSPGIVLAARSGGAVAHGRMGPAGHVGSTARFGRPSFPRFPRRHFPFRPFPFRPFPVRPLVGFGFAAPLFLLYDTNRPYYPYNPYCDPASGYYYPPWCN
jgi:hypothetical protein